MQLNELKQSLSGLSEDELRKMFLDLRSGRRVPKAKTVERAEKAKAFGITTKATMKESLRQLSPEDAAKLLAQLTGG